MVRIILGNRRLAIAGPPAVRARTTARPRQRMGVPRAARYDRAPRMESPMSEAVLVTVVGQVATNSLNRAQVHNAFDDALIADLTTALLDAERNPAVRVIVLTGTGEVSDAATAARIGLLHETVAADQLDEAVDRSVHFLGKGGPLAQDEAKRLALRIGGMTRESAERIDEENAALIARLRVSAER